MSDKKFWAFWQREWGEIHRLRVSAIEQIRKEDELSGSLVQEIFSANYYTLLAIAAIISTFGLLSNSTATVIGAMIVAPLMNPIISLAYALVVGYRRLTAYAFVRMFTGIGLTISLAYLGTRVIGFQASGSEILSRTEPTLLDLGVAIAAGVAGAFAKIRRSVSDAIPGVAISVALVPPLCVVGICIALTEPAHSSGAFILFLTNLIGIVISAAIVFLINGYGSWRQARSGLLLLVITMLGVIIPLHETFREMIVENRIRHFITQKEKNAPHSDGQIGEIEVKFFDHYAEVSVNIVQSPRRSIPNVQQRLRSIQAELSEKVGYPVTLRLRIFPLEIIEYEAEAPLDQNNSSGDNGR